MLAVKAKYENGAVRWFQRPAVSGSAQIIVVFDEIPLAQGLGDASSPTELPFKRIPGRYPFKVSESFFEPLPPDELEAWK